MSNYSPPPIIGEIRIALVALAVAQAI